MIGLENSKVGTLPMTSLQILKKCKKKLKRRDFGWCGCGGGIIRGRRASKRSRMTVGDENGCIFEFVIFLNDPAKKIWKRLKNGEDNPELEPWDCTFCGAKYGKVHHL